MTTHVAFVRVKNVKGNNIDPNLPQDMPYLQADIEEEESASYIAGGYEVMDKYEFAQMVIAMAPEMEAYQKHLEWEQKKKEVDEKLSTRASIAESIVVDIQKYISVNLYKDDAYKFQINPYSVSMFFQIWSLQFEIALQYLKANPTLNAEQKIEIEKLISDKIGFK